MDLAGALAYLDRHVNLEGTAGRVHGLSLDRMRELAHVLGDPQHAAPVIHLTGTNGKGSVGRILTSLLQASGLSVGTYTSPHLERVNERISWNGEPIPDDDLAEAIGAVAAVEDLLAAPPSYFEILTAAAFRWFADRAVDVVVLEVGMLGRFDATNVADAQVAVITNIGFDHTDGGPGWREAIADEKSGIVKPGSTLVLGETSPELQPVFDLAGAETTWRRGPDFACEANRVAVGGRSLDLRTPHGVHDEVYLPLHGAHQGDNAAIALAAAEAFFGRGLARDVIDEGFATARVPGRLELVARHPAVLLDGAHNPPGAEALAAALAESFTVLGSRYLVVGFLRPRDPAEMLRLLTVDGVDLVVACEPDSPRAVPAPDVVSAAEGLGLAAEAVADPVEAVARALALAQEEDLVVVAGSLYVVGAVRAAYARRAEDLATAAAADDDPLT